jgi:hypothetical protein
MGSSNFMKIALLLLLLESSKTSGFNSFHCYMLINKLSLQRIPGTRTLAVTRSMPGNGEYYKNKYGGGGKGKGGGGKGGGGKGDSFAASDAPASSPRMGGTAADLQALLRRIDGSSYGAYRDLEATWDFGHWTLTVGSYPSVDQLKY